MLSFSLLFLGNFDIIKIYIIYCIYKDLHASVGFFVCFTCLCCSNWSQGGCASKCMMGSKDKPDEVTSRCSGVGAEEINVCPRDIPEL